MHIKKKVSAACIQAADTSIIGESNLKIVERFYEDALNYCIRRGAILYEKAATDICQGCNQYEVVRQIGFRLQPGKSLQDPQDEASQPADIS